MESNVVSVIVLAWVEDMYLIFRV